MVEDIKLQISLFQHYKIPIYFTITQCQKNPADCVMVKLEFRQYHRDTAKLSWSRRLASYAGIDPPGPRSMGLMFHNQRRIDHVVLECYTIDIDGFPLRLVSTKSPLR